MTDYTEKLIDFMYVDKNKVASLLAQFLSEGLIEEQSTSVERTEGRKRSIGFSSAKMFSLLGISAEAGDSNANKTEETVRKNPEWAQAKALIQYVADAEAQQSCADEQVGQLRILSGKLSIYDLNAFRRIVENSGLKDASSELLSQNPQILWNDVKIIDQKIDELENSKSTEKNISNINSRIKNLKLKRDTITKDISVISRLIVEGISEFVRSSPFSIIAIIDVDECKYWFTLKENCLIHDQGDTILKFGFEIEGVWSVACIVDGMAYSFSSSSEIAKSANGGDGLFLYQMAEGLVNTSRSIAGRPSECKSVMPLVLFRDLGKILR